MCLVRNCGLVAPTTNHVLPMKPTDLLPSKAARRRRKKRAEGERYKIIQITTRLQQSTLVLFYHAFPLLGKSKWDSTGFSEHTACLVIPPSTLKRKDFLGEHTFFFPSRSSPSLSHPSQLSREQDCRPVGIDSIVWGDWCGVLGNKAR